MRSCDRGESIFSAIQTIIYISFNSLSHIFTLFHALRASKVEFFFIFFKLLQIFPTPLLFESRAKQAEK